MTCQPLDIHRSSTAGSSSRGAWVLREILPHVSSVRRKLRAMGVSPQHLEDIEHDAYVRLLNARTVEAVRDCKMYFTQTARSVVLSQLRRSSIVLEETQDEAFFETLAAHEPSPERIVEAKEELTRFRAAFGTLSKRTQQVVILRRLEGLSIKETSKALQISDSAVEKHLRSAIRVLRA